MYVMLVLLLHRPAIIVIADNCLTFCYVIYDEICYLKKNISVYLMLRYCSITSEV